MESELDADFSSLLAAKAFCCAQQTGMHEIGCGSTAYCYLSI
jgi:hypothetical protein